MEDLILISSGRGPVEVRRFVDALATHLCGLGGRETQRHGEPPDSVQLALEDGARWTGTHVLVSASRGRHARKRWFVRVDLVPHATEAPRLSERDLRIQATRAGGPGGQNVNKRSTAVRAVHTPSGLAVRAAGQRSQRDNRAAALRQLEEALASRHAQELARGKAQTRALHDRLERGAARFTWRPAPQGGLRIDA